MIAECQALHCLCARALSPGVLGPRSPPRGGSHYDRMSGTKKEIKEMKLHLSPHRVDKAGSGSGGEHPINFAYGARILLEPLSFSAL